MNVLPILVLLPSLVGAQLVGVVFRGSLLGGQACEAGAPVTLPPSRRSGVLLPTDGSEPRSVYASEPRCEIGPCGAGEAMWRAPKAGNLDGILFDKAPAGTPIWPGQALADAPACFGADEVLPLVRQRFDGGPDATYCEATAFGPQLGVQVRGSGWVQANGLPRYPIRQWRLLTKKDGATEASPWIHNADWGAGPHVPLLLLEVEAGARYEVVFEDEGGIGGAHYAWKDGLRRDAGGRWTAHGGEILPIRAGQPCD